MSYVVLIEFFQTFFELLVWNKNFLAFDVHFVQIWMNFDRKKILTEVISDYRNKYNEVFSFK